MNNKPPYVLYITDANEQEVQPLYGRLEEKGFRVTCVQTDVPGYSYGMIRTPTNRRETVKLGRLVLVEGGSDSASNQVLCDLIRESLPESVDVRAFEGNLEYRTKTEAGKR